MGAMITLSGNMIDGLGLTRDLTDDEMMLLAGQIGQIREVVDLVAGDMINQFCKRHGLPELTAHGAIESRDKLSRLSPLLNKLGYSLSYAAQHATIARTWPRSDRVGGLEYGHYKALAGCDGKNGRLTREQARQILLEAQIGGAAYNGKFTKPYPPAWVKKAREAKEGNPKKQVEVAVPKEAAAVSSQLAPEVEKVLTKAGLTERKVQAEVKKVEVAVQKTYKKFQDEFFMAVEKEAQKKASDKIEEYRVLSTETAKMKENLDRTIKGLAKPIDKDEFRFLRQFCHPDKHPGNEGKARKALEIVERIGSRLGFTEK
jgi:hypothetical protein